MTKTIIQNYQAEYFYIHTKTYSGSSNFCSTYLLKLFQTFSISVIKMLSKYIELLVKKSPTCLKDLLEVCSWLEGNFALF